MKCYNCGTENVDEARFCGKCGADLESVPSAKAQGQMPVQQAPPQELFRCSDDKQLGGVCAGIAKRANMDVSIVRLITILIFFFTASSIALVYLILWAVLPEAPCGSSPQ